MTRPATGSSPYGTMTVNGSAMTVTHTQGAEDAGDTFSIDAQGNLTVNTSKAQGAYSLEGGMLKAGQGEGSTAAQSVSYQYNADGLRVSKTADGVTTNYTLHGKLITHLKKGSDQMHFFYDAQGKPAMVQLNGTHYTYVHNLQGDIAAILDAANVKVIEYKCDAWGKPTDTWSLVHATDSTLTSEYAKLAALNPFRYRGYIYDQETGLYYLRSRYYDPTWARFLNRDSEIGNAGALYAHNIFSYCRNRPTMFVDPTGRKPYWGLLPYVFAQLIVETRGDYFGQRLVDHYVYGDGSKLTISNDPEWNQYMFDNEKFKRRLDTYAKKAIASGSFVIAEQKQKFKLTDSSGGYSTGYELINGLDIRAGGLDVAGTVTQLDDITYRVSVSYAMHDYMDVNPAYSTDIGAAIAAFVLIGYCPNYELEINGELQYDLVYRR